MGDRSRPDGPDYIVEIGGKIHSPAERTVRAGSHLHGRPWLAVQWQCCGVYSRVYRRRDDSAYRGHCPKCARPIHIRVSPSGTAHRFFEVW